MTTMTNEISLSPEQLNQYHSEGYTAAGRVLDDSQLQELREEESRFRMARGDTAEGTLFFSQMHDFSEPVRRFATAGAHLEMMKQLIGPNICLWFNQFVTKMPDRNLNKSEFPWHQDNGYVSIEPATNVTLWIALDDVDEENGCVWVMPKSHERGLLDHSRKSADSWHLDVKVEGDGVPAILRAGEAVAFTGLTLHRSKLNKTDKIRRGFFLEYSNAEAVFGEERTPVLQSPSSWMVCGQVPLVYSQAKNKPNK